MFDTILEVKLTSHHSMRPWGAARNAFSQNGGLLLLPSFKFRLSAGVTSVDFCVAKKK